MPEPGHCPQCGATLPPDAPPGVCPKCLLGLGLGAAQESAPAFAATAPPTPPGRFAAPQPAELAPHFPHLEILELLGQGGMGAVYKARQRQLHRLVALKILPPEVAQDSAFAERFQREAQALAQLNHPQIVSVYDSGKANGLYYFVMEYVDGLNLRRMLAEGKLAPAEALAIVPQICEALQYAHDEGVVHRDIKPENILLDKKGRVKIADFGLARLMGASRPELTLTGTQQVMGTPHYMAPEQMERPQTVDHRADIYSLGVVFYEMLTGELPLGRFQPPSKKVEVDVRLDEIVLRSLEKEPERRYQQVSSVKTELEVIAKSVAPTKPAEQHSANESHSGKENPFAPVGLPAHVLTGLRISGILLVVLGLLGGTMGFIGLGVIGITWGRVPNGFSMATGALGFVGMFVLGTLVANGGWAVLVQRNYRAALLGCLLSFALALMMNLDEKQNALFILGFVPGAVALYYLLQPEVKGAFQGAPKVAVQLAGPADVEEKLRSAGIWMTIAAAISLLFWIGMVGASLISLLGVLERGDDIDVHPTMAAILLALHPVPVIIAGLHLLAAVKTWTRRSRAWTIAAATFSCIPYSPSWIIGLPAAIYALVQLRKAPLQSLAPAGAVEPENPFAARKSDSGDSEQIEAARDQVRIPAIGLIVLGVIQCVVFGLVLLIGLVVVGFWAMRSAPIERHKSEIHSQWDERVLPAQDGTMELQKAPEQTTPPAEEDSPPKLVPPSEPRPTAVPEVSAPNIFTPPGD